MFNKQTAVPLLIFLFLGVVWLVSFFAFAPPKSKSEDTDFVTANNGHAIVIGIYGHPAGCSVVYQGKKNGERHMNYVQSADMLPMIVQDEVQVEWRRKTVIPVSFIQKVKYR